MPRSLLVALSPRRAMLPVVACAGLLTGCTQEVWHAYGEDAVLVQFEDGQAAVRVRAVITSTPAANPQGPTESQAITIGTDFGVPVTVRVAGAGDRDRKGWNGLDVDLPLDRCPLDDACTQVVEAEIIRRRPGEALTGWVTGAAYVTVPDWSPHGGDAPDGALRVALDSDAAIDPPDDRGPGGRGGNGSCGMK